MVVNAVDDLLDKGELANFEWTLESIEKPLQFLLSAAYEAGRIVVIAGDHGHILERGSELRSDDSGGSRWRLPGRDPAQADEVLVEGSRVLVDGKPWCSLQAKGSPATRASVPDVTGATPRRS